MRVPSFESMSVGGNPANLPTTGVRLRPEVEPMSPVGTMANSESAALAAEPTPTEPLVVDMPWRHRADRAIHDYESTHGKEMNGSLREKVYSHFAQERGEMVTGRAARGTETYRMWQRAHHRHPMDGAGLESELPGDMRGVGSLPLAPEDELPADLETGPATVAMPWKEAADAAIAQAAAHRGFDLSPAQKHRVYMSFASEAAGLPPVQSRPGAQTIAEDAEPAEAAATESEIDTVADTNSTTEVATAAEAETTDAAAEITDAVAEALRVYEEALAEAAEAQALADQMKAAADAALAEYEAAVAANVDPASPTDSTLTVTAADGTPSTDEASEAGSTDGETADSTLSESSESESVIA